MPPEPRRTPPRGLAALGALLAAAATLASFGVRPAPARNLALGHPVSWTRPPNYPHCTDPGDSLQLTDGAPAPGGYSWLDPRVVGWKGEQGDVIGIRIDLGRSCQIDSLRFSTVSFPPAEILPPSLLGVAGAAHFLTCAGALDAAALVMPDSRHPRRVTLGVPLHGETSREILVVALLRAPFLFVDEIEVHGSEAQGASAVPLAPARVPASSPARLRLDDQLPAMAARQRRLWALRTALPDAFSPFGATGDDEEALRLAERARAWRAAGAPPLAVRRVDPWAPTTPWSAPLPEIADTLHLALGAWGAAASEIACASERPARVPLELHAAPAGAPRATLRQVVCVEARDGGWAGDALPLASDSIALRPGEVRQVWIDIDTRDAAPGTYRVAVALGPRTLLVPVRVHSLRLPASPLAALDWTYPQENALTRDLAGFAVGDNIEHGIDTWCLPPGAVPWPAPGAIDARGHLTSPLDFAACDSALALHRAWNARRVGWYWDLRAELEDPSRGRFRHRFLSPAWRRAVSEWLVQWLAHLGALGYDTRRLFMMPFDEAKGRRVVDLLRFLAREQPALPLALTVPEDASASDIRAVQPWLEIVILGRGALAEHAGVARRRTAAGLDTWTYDVPRPAKTASPLAAYRLLAWEAWARGLQGCGFWAYGDGGSDSADVWDDFDAARSDFAVVYGRAGAPTPLAEPLVPSKRWQAFRIGLQETALLQAAGARLPDLQRRALAAVAAPPTEVEPLMRRVWRLLDEQ